MPPTTSPSAPSVRYSQASAARRSGSAHVRHGKFRPAANVDHAAPGMADHRQAQYFIRLLTQSRQLIDHRIHKYQRAIAISEASGDVDNVRGLRRSMGIEEKDRQVLEQLIDRLQRRFAPCAPAVC
jgi:hypothetical protein